MCSNHKTSQYGDQPTIKVNIRELKLVGFEIASCYARLSWKLYVKLERKEKKIPNKRNKRKPHIDSSPAAQQKVQKPNPGSTFKDISSSSQHSPATSVLLSLLNRHFLSLKSFRFMFIEEEKKKKKKVKNTHISTVHTRT